MKLSLHKDQRGLGTVAVVVVVVVIAVAGLVAWRVSQKDSTKDSAATGSKAAVTACNKVYKDKDLCKFTGSYAIDKLSYKMEVSTVDKTPTIGNDAGAGKTTTTLLNDGKGNSSLSGTSGGQMSEFIVLNKVSYMKDNTDGKWWKFAPNESGAPKPADINPVNNVKFDTSATTPNALTLSYKKLGKEACGQLTCFKYQMVDSSKSKNLEYFWFDTKDYRLQHYYSQADTSTTELTITYEKVTITAPSPTKEFSAGATQSVEEFQQNYTGPETGTSTDTGQ